MGEVIYCLCRLGGKMNIGIVGGGAIGLLVGSYLGNEHDITLYVRRDAQLTEIEEHNIQLQVNGEQRSEVEVEVKNISRISDHDCLFICVKQPQLKHVLPFLQHLKHDTPIVFLQNGMGHIEVAKQLNQASYLGVVEHGASKLNDYTVNHLGIGKIVLGSHTGDQVQLTKIKQAINQKDFPFEQSDEVTLLLKEKLIVNAVINPLTALFNVANGDIIENKHIKILAEKVCQEVANTLKLDEAASWRRVKTIAHNTRNNTSSMRADVLAKRETEIESIIGYVIEQGKEKLPYTTFIYHSILAKSY